MKKFIARNPVLALGVAFVLACAIFGTRSVVRHCVAYGALAVTAAWVGVETAIEAVSQEMS